MLRLRRRRRATREGSRVPVRTCVGCRRRASARELVRLRHTPGDTVELGPGAGRSAWLCAAPRVVDCFDEAVRRAALDRALRTSISRADVARLRAKLEGLPGARP